MPDLTAWQVVGWTLVIAVCLVIIMAASGLGLVFVRAGWRSHDRTPDIEKETPAS